MTDEERRTRLGDIEAGLHDLYSAGHATGHGPYKSSHPETCGGCRATRVLADDWDAWQRDFDQRRLEEPR